MTEINYKAKSITTGEWVESMTIAKGTIKRKFDDFFFEVGDDRWVGVVKETISRYTGLKSSDAGGMPIKEAYFGDIIKFFDTEGHEHHAEIIWYELELCIGFKRISDGVVYTQRYFNDSGYFQPSKIQFEIIGNVHDNAELSKTKA